MENYLVVMGASNVALAFPTVTQELVDRFAGAETDATLKIYAARGCGRSYGAAAGIFGFATQGLASCGLLDALAKEVSGKDAAITALLTDIGNDIVYGAGVDQILAWVSSVAERITALGGRVGLTSLPIESLAAVPAWKFHLLRRLFYPFRPMTYDEVMRQAREIQTRLEVLSEERGWRVLKTPASWYRFDHFHLKRRRRREAFGTWVNETLDQSAGALAKPARGRLAVPLDASRLRLRYHRPAEYRWLGRWRHGKRDGLRVAPRVHLYCY